MPAHTPRVYTDTFDHHTLATRQQLADYTRERLGLTLARAPLSHDTQAPLDYLDHTFFEHGDAVVWANRGGGKTMLAAVATLLDLIFKPGIEVRLLGGSLDQSARMFEHLTTLFARPDFADRVAGRITRRGLRLQNGSRVELLAQSETSVRGTRVQRVRCDEVDLFSREVWDAVQLTTRSTQGSSTSPPIRASIDALSTMQRPFGLMWDVVRHSGGEHLLAGAPAPPPSAPRPAAPRRVFRWGIIDSLEHCPPERECATCPIEPDCQGRAHDRPPHAAGHISIADAITQIARVSRNQWESEMLCLRPRRDHTVFPEFSDALHAYGHPDDPLDHSALLPLSTLSAQGHSVPPAPGDPAPPLPLICGMDFGYRNKTAVLWCTLDPSGLFSVIAELICSEKPLHHYLGAIRDFPLGLPRYLAVDAAGNQHSLQTGTTAIADLRSGGLIVRSRAMPVVRGLNMIRARLAPAAGPPTLRVHRRCRGLIESLHRYHFDAADPYSTTPVKDGFDHAVDALRYLIVETDTLFGAALRPY
ncbi:MAG: hypothetical protein ACT4PL_05105 [Phycisphaerales bacterium]